MQKPKISVLMPAYNAEKYIAEAIESILNQTFNDFEFIIVDDASTDQTQKIIERYKKKDKRIIYIKNKLNQGVCKSLNIGIERAKGRYVVRMDADDWSFPNRLKLQYDFMEKNPSIGISGGTMEVCDENMKLINNRSYQLSDSQIRKKIFLYSPFSHPSTIWRKEIMIKAGKYDERFDKAEDYDLYFRVGLISEFANLKNTLIRYRTSQNSASFKNSHRHELLTLYARIKAVMEYRYHMTLFEFFYLVGQFVSIFIIPFSAKNYIFTILRK